MAEKKRIKIIKKSPRKLTWRDHKRRMILNSELSKFRRAFKNNFLTLIVSALGLVSALSWNDAIKSAIKELFPEGGDVVYKFYVAIAVTIIAVVITYFLSRMKTKQ